MALADQWQEEGKTDLAEFICNRRPRIVNEATETAKEPSGAQARLQRCTKSRIQLLEKVRRSYVLTVVKESGLLLQKKF